MQPPVIVAPEALGVTDRTPVEATDDGATGLHPSPEAVDPLFAGPGEMCARCRDVDWDATPLGPVERWPVSLRTIVGMMFAARHPMILFWGPERVQLYNDAYIPTLGGPDRHPAALAMGAEECWAGEVWRIVGPQIEQVMQTGAATWHVDQYVPLPRHGRIEPTHWTYGYSPVHDDDGQIAGVLVITHETTTRMSAERARQRLTEELTLERSRLTAVFQHAPVAVAVLRGHVARELEYELANDRYRQLIPPGRAVVGRTLGAVLPELTEDVLAIHQRVLDTGEPFAASELRVPLDRDGDGVLEEYYFNIAQHPLQDADGGVAGLIFVVVEVTELVHARQETETALSVAEQERQRAESLLDGMADAYFAIDPEFRVVAANGAMERRSGLARTELIGRSVWELFPGTIGTQIEAQYRQVASSRTDAHFTHDYSDGSGSLIAEVDVYPYADGGVAVFWRDVTARAQAATALAESEARLRAVYDGTYEYIGITGPDGTLLDCNRASLAFAGNRREEVIGRPFWDTPWFATTPGAPDWVRRGIARAANGEFVRQTLPLTRPSGEVVTFDFSLYPIRDADGSVGYIVPEWRDISDRVVAEAALRESESRYRTLFETVDQGFCVIDVEFDEQERPVDYRFIETNPAFVEQSGLVDAAGHTARELVPDLEQHWFDTYGRVALTGESIRFDNRAESMGRWFSVYAFRIGEATERRVALLFTDVTTARAAEAERELLLRELEIERSRLWDVFRQAPAFLAVLRGPAHVFEMVNDAYYQLIGHREVVGRPLREALPEVAEQGFEHLLDRVLATGEPFHGLGVPVVIARKPDAPPEQRYLDLSYLPMLEADGTRGGVIAHGADVTQQVLARRDVERLLVESESARAEAEVARAEAEVARAEAEAANRAKGEFLAVMSHELRTPLNAIGGYAELMEMGIRGAVTPLQREDLRRIQTSQRHLLGLINEVLNYAKLETGTVHYDVAAVSVREALTSAESLVMPQARSKGIGLTVGECAPMLTVRADAEKLRQILVNLLSNAIKFTDRGSIDLSAHGAGDQVAIVVRDTGIGIPADKLAEIFDPFVQVRANLTRQHEGTGLGLAISRDLARGMSGDLTAESVAGVGSAFTLTLPRST